MAAEIRIKSGPRAKIDAAKNAGGLNLAEPYLITDENRIAVGTGPSAMAEALMQSDASATPAANKLVRAGADGKINPAWLHSDLDLRIREFGVNPTLDLDFVRQRYRHYDAAQGGLVEHSLSSFLTFLRQSGASYFGPDGQLRAAAADVPRIDYAPESGGCLGFLVEGAATNFLVQSEQLSSQSVAVENTDYTLSFRGPGQIVLSGAYSATVTGEGAYPARTVLSFKPDAGILTLTVSGICRYAQLERNAYATSWVATTDTATTRTEDAVSITGANFSSWYNQDGGTFLVQYMLGDKLDNIRSIALLGDTSTGDQISFFAGAAGNMAGGYVTFRSNNVTAALSQAGAVPNRVGAVVNMAARLWRDDIAYTNNGGEVCRNPGEYVMPTIIRLLIGWSVPALICAGITVGYFFFRPS